MAVLDAQGTTITITDGTTATTVATTIGGVVSYTFGDGEASDIDITTLASTAKEFRQGLQDFGGMSLELMRDPTDVGQIEMEVAKAAQATRQVVITLPGGQIATFNAYVKSLSSAGGVDAVVTGSSSLKVTGEIVWT